MKKFKVLGKVDVSIVLMLFLAGVIIGVFSQVVPGEHTLIRSVLDDIAAGFMFSAVLAFIQERISQSHLIELILSKVNLKKEISEIGVESINTGADKVDFNTLIENGKDNIDIVHAYGRTWTGTQYSSLVRKLRDSNCNIRVVLLDPNSDLIPAFAKYSRKTVQELKEEIEKVTKTLKRIYEDSGIDDVSRFKIYYHNGLQTTALYRADSKLIAVHLKLSSQSKELKFPTIICNATNTNHDLFHAYMEDMEDLINESTEIDLSTITT